MQAQSRRNTDLARAGDPAAIARSTRSPPCRRDAVPIWPTELAEQASAQAGFTPVTGPPVTVTLDDAPASITADGVDPDLLVVHQQDIQAVVNALWRGGAEAMTIQGQRVISTTGSNASATPWCCTAFRTRRRT